MAGEHARVRVVEDRRLDPPAEQLVGLAHEVLVERVLGRDEHREPVAAPPGAAPLLAQRGDRARESRREITASSRPMSIPSSSAFVEETPSSSPSASRRSISRRCAAV